MSDFIILYCQNKGVSINPLKLQKLLYYIQSWNITKFEKDILFEDLPEAWVNGPVYRKIYDIHKTNFFRNENFPVKYHEAELSEKSEEALKALGLSEEKQKLVFGVLDLYSKMSDERLVFMTHAEEPWNKARAGLQPLERSEKKISADDIFNYYNDRLKKNGRA